MILCAQVFTGSDPIAGGASWTAAADYASEVTWQDAVCGNLSTTNIISAGVFFGTSPMSIAGLAAKEGDANQYVKDYCSHNYPQSKSTSNLAKLMSHNGIASQIKPFAGEVSAAAGKGKPHIFGETNSGKTTASVHYGHSNPHNSNSRWRWHQPDIWSRSVDPRLCDANSNHGNKGASPRTFRRRRMLMHLTRLFTSTKVLLETVSGPIQTRLYKLRSDADPR